MIALQPGLNQLQKAKPTEMREEMHPDKICNLNENFSNLKVRVASPKGGMVRRRKPDDESGISYYLNQGASA